EKVNENTFLINGGYAGFYRFYLDHHTGVIRFEEKKFLPNYRINCLLVDSDLRLWIGTTTGLLQQRMNDVFIKKYDLAIDDYTIDGYEDAYRHKGKLYLCRYSRDVGLVIVDPVTMKILDQLEFYGRDTSWNEIYTIEMYHPDTLWLGTSQGILWMDTKTNHYGKLKDLPGYTKEFCLTNIFEKPDADGYAWMCYLLRGIVVRYHIPSRSYTIFTEQSHPPLPFNKVKSIVNDVYGDVWIGGHSLARWNHLKDEFDTLITVYGGTNKFNDNILAMTPDDHGSIWMHNVDNGLLEYRIGERKFTNYSMKDGFPSNTFLAMSPVINQKIWIGSHHHLTGFDTQTKKMEVYSFHDGLPSDNSPINTKMFFDSTGQRLLMFFKNEVVTFPVNYHYPTDENRELRIEKLIVNNTQSYFYPDHAIRLKPDEKNVSITYSIIDFEGGNNYQFAYKINNSDNWTSLGDERSINLSGLSTGFYALQLKATGKSGEEKIKSFSFSIAPPFWKTDWFFSICILLVAALAFFIYRLRIRKISQKANIDKLLSQTEMKALHAQMNPHFIFNSLNSIREMILNNENTEASRFLSKFAHLIRITLDQSGQSFISLRNTIDYLQRYIEMEKIRNVNFKCDIIVDPALELDETILPPMLIQPFIENAIWHGTTSARMQIYIHVEFKKQNDQLICIVDDNGIGIETSLSNKNEADRTRHSVGITNIKSRIQLLNKKHNLQSSVSVEDKSRVNGKQEKGTRVTLRLPLEMAGQ
ncbi:MAG: histidine kinase, partial [Saprospiraceae bacterium]